MADAEDLTTQLKRFEGLAVDVPVLAPESVNASMIRHWCEAVEDRNPVYTDPDFAQASVHGGIVAPPTMLQAWTMRGLRPPAKPAGGRPGPQAQLFELLDAAGFSSVVATNCTQEYKRYLRPGDRITVSTAIESVSCEKQTALGAGHFITQRMTYCDQAGEEVATMRFRLLKFRPLPAAQQPPAAAVSGKARRRPRPGITHDNRFFWEGLGEGKLLVQRCASCGTLRHPPGPMCPRCQSLDWKAQQASGRGVLYSWVVMHHPPVPPFEYPNPIALVELEEGVRIVAQLVGVERSAVEIGMPLVCEVVEVEEDFPLPQFRAAGEQETPGAR